jgi:hypothetical protein
MGYGHFIVTLRGKNAKEGEGVLDRSSGMA